ncbi:MAG: YbhN family protein [Ruminococcus sp.]
MKKPHISFKLVFNVLVIGLCLGISAFFFFSKDGLNDLLHSNHNVLWYWIIVAVASQLVYMLMETIVVYIFIKEEYPNFSFLDAVKVALTGLFWSAITPSSTGGQPMQIYLLYSMKIEIGYGTSRLVQKFLVYQIVLTSISIASVIINFRQIFESKNISLIIILLAFGFVSQIAVTLIICLFSFSPNLSRKVIRFLAKILAKFKIVKNLDEVLKSADKQLDTFHNSNKDIYKKPKLLIPAIILTIIQFIAMFLVPYFIYLALFPNPTAGPVTLVTSQAFVNLMSGMIPIPGASGAAEIGFTAFFGPLFLGTLKSATLIWRTINYYGVVLFTAPFAYITKGKTDEAKAAHEKLKSKDN